MAKRKTLLKYDPVFYTPAALIDENGMTYSEQKQEYTRLRRAALRRLKEIESSEYGGVRWRQELMQRLKPYSAFKKESTFRQSFADVARFLSSQTSTLSALRERDAKSRATLEERYKIVFKSDEEFRQFGDFLESIRQSNLGRIYSSDRAISYLIYKQDRGEIGSETIRGYQRYVANREKEMEELGYRKKPRNKRYASKYLRS